MTITQRDWRAMDGEAILQIMPASGVSALFSDGEKWPVVCWALIEVYVDDEDPVARYQQVVGMILLEGVRYLVEVGSGEHLTKFVGYEYDS